MRFGIMTMQKGMLIPSSLPAGGLAQHVAGFDHAGMVRRLAEAGLDLIEISGDVQLFFPQAFGSAAVEQLAALKKEKKLAYTVHLPLWSLEVSTPLTPVRQGSVRAVVDTIRATQVLEPEAYVLHATGPLAAEFGHMPVPAPARGILLRIFQQQAAASLQQILAETGLPSRRLAVETIEFPLELTLELAEKFDTSICFDTGHVLAGFSGQVDFFDALERCLPRLGEIHLHDTQAMGPQGEMRYGQDHRPLGQGDLELGRLLARLEAANYQGPIIFELTVEETMASLEVIRRVRSERGNHDQ